MINAKYQSSGQSLFEVIFALGIAAIILVAMAGLSVSTLRNSTFSTDSATATQLASQATEWLRSQRDACWTTNAPCVGFVTRASSVGAGTTWCLSTLNWPGTAGACGPQVTGTNYTRSVLLKSRDADSVPGIDTVDAEVTVSWTDSQGIHDIKNNASYTDWRR
jgi:Tfp pilus assembly protein PilV